MSMKKVLVLIMVMSVLAVSATASFAAAKKNTSAQAATIGGVGIVDRGEILNNHPKLEQVRQQLANIARQKENEAKAAADKETDTAKKAQAVQDRKSVV